jgi:hypothetical protein
MGGRAKRSPAAGPAQEAPSLSRRREREKWERKAGADETEERDRRRERGREDGERRVWRSGVCGFLGSREMTEGTEGMERA